MKTFDEILEAAFAAGRERGLDEAAEESGNFVMHNPAPDFRTWRRSLGDPE